MTSPISITLIDSLNTSTSFNNMVESVKKYNIFRQTWLPIFTCLRLKRYVTILSRKNIRYKKIDHQ